MEKIKRLMNKNAKIILLTMSILFLLPSIIYFYNNRTVYLFSEENTFFLTHFNSLIQAICFFILIVIFIIFYYIVIKNRNKLFKNTKSVFLYILLISLIFSFIIPFLSSDIFYYLGIGRLNSEYLQNPYYITIRQYISEENIDLPTEDTVFMQGYNNYWADTTVVYGPVWTIICAIIAKLSLGNIDLGLLLFKTFNLAVHMLNCYIPYLPYMKDLSIFTCMLVQRDRFDKGFLNFVLYVTNSLQFTNYLKEALFIVFVGIYTIEYAKLLFQEEIVWRIEMRRMYTHLLFFIVLLLTNAPSWYFIWLYTTIIWQKAKNIDFIIKLNYILIMAYTLYIYYGFNGNRTDIKFFVFAIIGVFICLFFSKENVKK